MTRILLPTTVAALLGLTTSMAFSQQLRQPNPPATPARPVTQDSGLGPRLKTARPPPLSTVPADPGQRPPGSDPIPSTGPSVPPPAKIAIKSPEPADRDALKPVVDARGRLVPGALRVSPTRGYDPATGRYFDTMPTSRPR